MLIENVGLSQANIKLVKQRCQISHMDVSILEVKAMINSSPQKNQTIKGFIRVWYLKLGAAYHPLAEAPSPAQWAIR